MRNQLLSKRVLSTALTIVLIAALQSCCSGTKQDAFKDKLTAYLKKRPAKSVS